jgi:uncharacterized protein (DUF433 family)
MAQQAAQIVRTDDVLGGEPRIEGRRIGVRQLRALVEERGLPADEVAARFDLQVADVYAALTYYHEHPEEMAELEAERERLVEESLERGATTHADFEGEGQ